MLKDNEIKKWLTITIIVSTAFLIVNNIPEIINIISTLLNVLTPFILGGVIAYILNIPLVKIEKLLGKKIKNQKTIRVIAIILSLLIFVLIIAFVLLLLIPELIESIENLLMTIPSLFNQTQNWILDLLNKYPDIQNQMETTFSKVGNISDIVSKVLNYVIDSSIKLLSEIISSIITIFMSLIFAIYMLSQKEYLISGLKKIIYAFFKEKNASKIIEISRLTNKTFTKFISGQCLESCILGGMMFVVLTIFSFPYALIISVLTAVTALIPVFGAIVAMVVGAILIGIINPLQSLLFIVVFQTIQQIEGNLIYPKVVGKSVGLSSLWTLLAITVGGNLFGVVGMLIGLPIASIIYALLKEITNEKLKSKKIVIS